MRVITRGKKVGPCNICGTDGPLTEDHIPPKGVSRLGQVTMMSITDLLAVHRQNNVQRPNRSTRFSQDGVKFRTLCGQCNNERLGLGYDPTLISAAKDVRAYLESALYLPPEMRIQTRPNRLVRSIVGHLLAHGVDEHRNGEMIERLTDYFLDESCSFPQEFKLYYWVYPYNDQVVVKGASVSLHYWNSFAVFMLMKFFPFSFFFVLDEPPQWRLPFLRLDTMLTNCIDDETALAIKFTGLPHQRWPEAPGNTGMLLYGEGAMGAIPRVP